MVINCLLNLKFLRYMITPNIDPNVAAINVAELVTNSDNVIIFITSDT